MWASPGDTFKILASFTGKSKSILIPSELIVHGAVTSDPTIITKACVEHFFPEKPSSDSEHSATLDAAHLALKLSDSEGPHVSNFYSLPVIKPLIFKLLNACLLLSFFPNNSKLSKVVVIGKPYKPDYSTLKSFKPISLVSNLAKLLEKVILDLLIWYSRSLNWISDLKHSFREGRSTLTVSFPLLSLLLRRERCVARQRLAQTLISQ